MNMKLAIAALAICLTACSAPSEPDNVILHYDFAKSEGNVVKDASKSGFDATLCGSAVLEKYEDFCVVNLGQDSGYVDMGTAIGEKLAGLDEFSVKVTYLVKEEASLKGHGYFLFAFSCNELNSAEDGCYLAYKLNIQRAENTFHGWNHETAVEVGNASDKGTWQTVVYTQKGKTAKLFINGQLQDCEEEMQTNAEVFPNGAPTFNWMGRAPFPGDNYLAGTLIKDVCIYNTAIDVE